VPHGLAIGAGSSGIRHLEATMKVRGPIAAVAALALIGGGAALALPAAASTTASTSKTHTLKFISVTGKAVNFTKANFGQEDTDVTAKGKLVGFDTLNISVNAKTGKGAILVTVDASGGFLIGVLPVSGGKILPGQITGGIGVYKDAFGSIVTKSLNKPGTRTAVTIKYTT
jgi:ABC-type glycerol-3-phosphate transport system substrate-binding protein